MNYNSETSLIAALELYAHRDRSSRPMPKIWRPLFALRERWNHSLWRIVVGEICRLISRIGAVLRTPNLRVGVALPPDPTANRNLFLQSQGFLRACSDHIQQQQSQAQWCGPLEAQMLGRAFAKGVEWHYRTYAVPGAPLTDGRKSTCSGQGQS